MQKYQNTKEDNKPLETVEEIKYLVKTLKNKNCNCEVTKSSLDPLNACYQSVQNLSSSSFISKNIKINMYRIVFFLFCMDVKLFLHIYGGTLAESVREECGEEDIST
jgi:hypothetical protein